MATFVLVAGFHLGGWTWRRVAGRLREPGHTVYPLSLTGLAERVHLASPQVDLETHVADILNLLEYEELREVILVGHSYGGLPVRAAADRAASRIGGVVYVDSGPLPDGVAYLDGLPPAARQQTERQVAEQGDGWRIPPPAWDPAADPVNLAGLEPDHLALLRRLSVPQPFGTATQPVRVRGAAHPATTLISCTFPPDQVRALIASGHPFFRGLQAGAFRLVELPTGHYPMLSRPADLARLLAEAAR